MRSAAPATFSLDSRSGRFTQEQRQVLASAPLAFLPMEDVIAYHAQPADRATINLNQTAERAPPHLNNQTVAAVTAKMLRATRPHDFGARSFATMRKGILTWFGATAPFNDAPRRDPELGLSKEDWEFLKNMLAVTTYVDVMGHRRHHASLQHFKDTRDGMLQSRDHTTRSNAQQQLAKLDEVVRKSKVQLQTLHKRVVAKFEGDIEQRMEYFKEMRVHGDSQAAAQRLRGTRPMEESYHTTKTVLRLQSDNAELLLRDEKVMKWKDPAGDVVKDLRFDESAWHLTGCLDGCSVHVAADPQMIAQRVYCLVRCGPGCGTDTLP